MMTILNRRTVMNNGASDRPGRWFGSRIAHRAVPGAMTAH